jgi:hypothetical protein
MIVHVTRHCSAGVIAPPPFAFAKDGATGFAALRPMNGAPFRLLTSHLRCLGVIPCLHFFE